MTNLRAGSNNNQVAGFMMASNVVARRHTQGRGHKLPVLLVGFSQLLWDAQDVG